MKRQQQISVATMILGLALGFASALLDLTPLGFSVGIGGYQWIGMSIGAVLFIVGWAMLLVSTPMRT